MTTCELMQELRRLEIGLMAVDGKLRFRAPAGALTPQLRADIVRHRPEILRRLAADYATPRTADQKCETCKRENWIDETPRDCRIRTHCGKCWRFIGYRPVDVK